MLVTCTVLQSTREGAAEKGRGVGEGGEGRRGEGEGDEVYE